MTSAADVLLLLVLVTDLFIVSSGLYTAHRERVRRPQLLALGEPSPNA